MNNISLYKPVILRKSLKDMTEKQRQRAEELLCSHLFVTVSPSGLEFIENRKDIKLPDIFFYGSEAVCIYRQSLGLPDVSVRHINVNDILTKIDGFDACSDILFFLHNVHMRNDRARYLQDIGAPAVILYNEYQQLQERVEFLEDNHWCNNPVINSFDVPYEDDAQEPDHYEEIRKSLADIGLSLLPQENDNKESARNRQGKEV